MTIANQPEKPPLLVTDYVLDASRNTRTEADVRAARARRALILEGIKAGKVVWFPRGGNR